MASWEANIDDWCAVALEAGDDDMYAVFAAAYTERSRGAVRRAIRIMYDYYLSTGDSRGEDACLSALAVLRCATPAQVAYFLTQEVYK